MLSGEDRLRVKLVVLCLVGVLLSGCATSLGHYRAIETSLREGAHEQVVLLIEKARDEGTYEKKDRVLYSLELGLAHHYADQYEKSNERLTLADEYMDELFTKSISNMGYSFLTNNTQLPYRGEPHENIYLNAFKALNYAHLDRPQDVFVEVRKIDNKLSRMETQFKRMAEEYRESALESVGENVELEGERVRFETGETKFHTSALGRYLGYIMYLTEGNEDDARIDLNKMREAFQNQPGIYNFDFPDIPRDLSVPADRARVNVFGLLGRGPIKVQRTLRVRYRDYYFKWVFPELKKRGTEIDRVIVERNGSVLTTLDELEDINRVSEAIFRVKAPLIKAHNFVRALSKAIASKEVRDNNNAGPLGVLATVAAQEFTENADLRTTRLLPGEVHVGHFLVPADEPVDLTVKYYSNGSLIGTRQLTRTFERGEPNFLELVNFR